MRQVKLFKTVENEIWALEREINSWIEESGAKVISVTGNIAAQSQGESDSSFSASDVLVIVLYEQQ